MENIGTGPPVEINGVFKQIQPFLSRESDTPPYLLVSVKPNPESNSQLLRVFWALFVTHSVDERNPFSPKDF